MDISTRHIGGSIIEMTVEDGGTTMTTDITNRDSLVDEQFIENLKNIAEELEQHNFETLNRMKK